MEKMAREDEEFGVFLPFFEIGKVGEISLEAVFPMVSHHRAIFDGFKSVRADLAEDVAATSAGVI